ncbi:hypothetical protein BOTBODRAFT_35216 [Botryobasidium botryosum FD-172 SS1]|uniref:Eukaryotic translation initiation factor 5B n=1 Tax=Botryobasidium botryosum (strain FD-172 SS1) TaxID=930990 RepID=A0A067M7K2_BOTB1|nr:hypothetical protein BOTBODRAFT_35216 [Botryobasidium botryosum FD-172 SS1]
MPPKGKGKKGKKNDDDFWDKAGEPIAANPAASGSADVSDHETLAKPKASGFAALMADPIADEEEDFGGLMSAIKASAAKTSKKDKKKGKKAAAIDDDDLPAPADDAEPVAPKEAAQPTLEEMEDEWAAMDKKPKKGKKAAAKSAPAPAPEPELEPSQKDAEEADGDGDGDDGEDASGGPVILSKKEKERLKKEREKAKKKAQAAAKKAAAGDAAPDSPVPAPAPTPAAAPPPAAEAAQGDEDGEEDEGPGGKSDKKKKKKKKGAAAEEKKAEPAKKKPAAGVSALKALLEKQKREEEERKRQEEEELRRIEEEERLREEEERRKEEEKARRKEKEKAKRELAKKEGRILTKKQKEEKAAAEIRRQALIASGVQIEGLQENKSAAAAGPKKVVYGNKKKKPAAGQQQKLASRPETPEVSAPPSVVDEEQPKAVEKEDWEMSEEESAKVEEKPAVEKDEWDMSGEDEKPAPAKGAPAVTKAKPPPTAATNGSAPKAPASSAAAGKKPAPSAKAAPPKEESEEESEEDDDDSEEDSDEDDSEDDSDEELTATQRAAAQRKAEAAERRAQRMKDALAARSKDDLRSPICCILGHVDTGKTKLLDKIRQTNVQEGEAGGITQQIGATYFPVDAIKTKTAVLNTDGKQEYKIPGLLVIDTPGHESFTNLRSRGSSLCNIAILVVDIMHGLEPQTLESLRLLRDRKTPFIVALNKIDRIYDWVATPDNAFQDSLAKQKPVVQREFERRLKETQLAFSEQGLNAVPYYENKNFAKYVSLVPTSAITGEGVPDMIMLLVNLTQQRMSDRLMYLSELECTVLEVKVIEGLGTTIDVVLSNGILREGDRIVVCGLNGPIVTQVRALLTPQPLRELRIKSNYVHHKEVKAALGVKITAPDLEKAIAGSRLLVVGPDDDEEDLKDEIMTDLTSLTQSIDKSGQGVCVQASTLGSLEALLDFLKSSKIPVSGINIGPVHKKDIMRAATMLEKAKELACILCFDVTVDKDAEKVAEELGIRLFKADIIYHLFDAFTAYNAEIMEAKRRDAAPQAVWPCRLKTIAAFCKRDPIILGVDILDGTLRVGTPICVVKTDPVTGKKDIIPLGKVTSLEINHKNMDIVKKSQAGAGVAVKIEHAVYQSAKMFGRHFDEKDELYSQVTRQSIDVLKESFKADVSIEEWQLIRALKPRLNIA